MNVFYNIVVLNVFVGIVSIILLVSGCNLRCSGILIYCFSQCPYHACSIFLHIMVFDDLTDSDSIAIQFT